MTDIYSHLERFRLNNIYSYFHTLFNLISTFLIPIPLLDKKVLVGPTTCVSW